MSSPYVVGGAVLAGAVIGGVGAYVAEKEVSAALSDNTWLLVTIGVLSGAGLGALIGSKGKLLEAGFSDLKRLV